MWYNARIRRYGKREFDRLEIAAALEVGRGGSISESLDVLAESGFVAKDEGYNPETGKPARQSRYRICDNYTTCKLHSFRIWRDGKLIHEFLPARLPSGVLNLVDYGPDPIPVTRNGLFQAGPELPPKSGLIILFRGR